VSRQRRKSVKRVVVILVLAFVVLYVGQIAFYSARETYDTVSVPVGLHDQIDVSILLGATPADKYVPGLGMVRIFTGKPLRIEARYKSQRDYRGIEKLEEVKLDLTQTTVDSEKYYVYVNVFEKPFEFRK
jgi:hypothetical protein